MGLNLHGTFAHLRDSDALPMDEEAFTHAYNRIAEDIYDNKATLFPGVRRLIEEIDAAGIPLGLASSSRLPWIMTALERFELDRYFTTVVSGEEFPERGKPYPDIYLCTAKQLGVDPKECIAIEDSTNGIKAAKAAGMRCIAFQSGSNEHQDLSGADTVTEAMQVRASDLLKLL